MKHLHFSYILPEFDSRDEWENRKKEIKERILLSAGLIPFPEKTPLNVKIFDKKEYDGYSIEKVYFESYPGFLVTGNLFRPLGKKGYYPAILNPHGHWGEGRLAQNEYGNIPARCLTLARLGFIAFMYDMVGYNDSQLDGHNFPENKVNQMYLWGISSFGLQIYNSIRCIDFLSCLDDVDKNKIGCTGESGGGTQTYILSAIDDRIKCSVPVCMVSAHFQGGCICENGPALRLNGINNVEIAACFAPNPLFLISCTKDWTMYNPIAEFPSIKKIYSLYNAENKVGLYHQDFVHNYNKNSREAMYGWFLKWFKGKGDGSPVRETNLDKIDEKELLVFPEKKFPIGFSKGFTVLNNIKELHKKQIDSLLPKDKSELIKFIAKFKPVYKEVVSACMPLEKDIVVIEENEYQKKDITVKFLKLSRRGYEEKIPAVWITSKKSNLNSPVAFVVYPQGKKKLFKPSGYPNKLLIKLLNKGYRVLGIDVFQKINDKEIEYFYTYNLSGVSNCIQNILTGLGALLQYSKSKQIDLFGFKEAGLLCLLAGPLCDEVRNIVSDMCNFDFNDDNIWLKKYFLPLIKRIGDINTVGILNAPKTLYFYNLNRKNDISKTDEYFER